MELKAGSGFIQTLRDSLHTRFRHWVARRIPPHSRIQLNQHNIFIIPNLQGMAFCFVLVLMFIGAINYEANLAFALVFLLTGMFLISIFHTFRNLSGLHLSAVNDGAVFATENAEICVVLNRFGKRQHEALELGFPGSQRTVCNLVHTAEVRVSLYVPARERGYLDPGRLRVQTVYPFGICRAWSLPDLDLRVLVYPAPIPCDVDSLITSQLNSGNTNMRSGNDDFYGLRDYQPGDSLRHVAWKNFARGQGMYTKQFSSHTDDKIWLDWEMFPGQEMEARLSRLCYCVLHLDSCRLDYGLRLPGIEIAPARGTEQLRTILQHLALFGSGESAG